MIVLKLILQVQLHVYISIVIEHCACDVDRIDVTVLLRDGDSECIHNSKHCMATHMV